MRTTLVSLVCALALVGCNKDKKEAGGGSASGTASASDGSASGSSGSAASGSSGSTAPVSGGPAGMKVLDQGSEPRIQLVYKIPPNSKQSFTTTMDMSMDMGAAMGGKMKLPSMQMDGDVAFGEPKGAGVPFTLTTSKLEFVDTPGAAVPASMINDKLKGVSMTATGTLQPNGHLDDFNMDAKNAPPEMQQTLDGAKRTYDQMVTQLPDVPVGKGARWQIVQKIDENGIKAEQTAVFEVVDIQGTTIKLKSTVALSAPPQTITTNGVTADLKKMAGTGSADLTLDLTKMIGPTNLTIHIDQELSAMGQSIAMAMDIVTKMEPK
ncbi:MAG TPA: DUF6263 family protein [Kofleriaceae bacterium]|nr:DUF6263 family protein [Kofleriaceae bacterium]